MENDSKNWTTNVAKIAFLIATVSLLIAVFVLWRYVLHACILGLLFAIMLMPVHVFILRSIRRIRMRIRRHLARKRKDWKVLSAQDAVLRARRIRTKEKNLASLVSVVLTASLVLVPLWMLIMSIVHQGYTLSESAQHWIKNEMPGKVEALIAKYDIQTKYDKVMRFYTSVLSGEAFTFEEKKKASSQSDFQSSTSEVPESKGTIFLQLGISVPSEEPPDVVATEKADGISEKTESNDKTDLVAADAKEKDAGTDIKPQVLAWAGKAMDLLRQAMMYILSKVWVFVFNFCVMLFVMYQVFSDGNNIWRYIRRVSPLEDEEQFKVEKRVINVTRAIFYGVVITSVTQTILSAICFKIIGLPALLCGMLYGVSALIPIVGTCIVWIPIVLFLLLNGLTAEAIFILVFCGILISNLDMLLRPFIMRKSGETGMSYMVLFLSILGGIQTFGIVGIIYGPMITGLCSIFLFIFSTQFKNRKKLVQVKDGQ